MSKNLKLKDVFKIIFEQQAEANTQVQQPFERHVMKAQEELGEVSEAYLKLVNYKRNKEKKYALEENLHEEIVDLFIMDVVLAHESGLTEKQFMKLLAKKLEKWRNNHMTKN